MNKGKGSPKIFFGWWTVLVAGLVSGLGTGFYGSGISVFFKSMAADLGLSRAVTSVAAGIGRLEGGLEGPITGWMVDKFGPKWVIFIGTCIVILGLALMPFINSLWTYYLVWGGIVGLGSNLGLTLARDKAVANWFVRKRGLALGLMFALNGVSTMVLLPIVGWLVAAYGWRTTNLVWAVVILACLPFLWLFIKPKRPEYYGLLPDGAKGGEMPDANQTIEKGAEYAAEASGEVEFTFRQAARTRAYWMLVVAWSCGMTIVGAINIHIIPFLTDMGIDPLAASGMMAMMVFFTMPGRFFGGILADRFKKEHLQYLLAGTFFFMAAGVTTFLIKPTVAMIFVFLALYGFGNGASTPLRVMIGGRYFGRKAFGTILGTVTMLSSIPGFIAPIFSGWIYDTTGSYRIAFIILDVLTVLAVFLMLLVRPPRPPSEVTGVEKFM